MYELNLTVEFEFAEYTYMYFEIYRYVELLLMLAVIYYVIVGKTMCTLF